MSLKEKLSTDLFFYFIFFLLVLLVLFVVSFFNFNSLWILMNFRNSKDVFGNGTYTIFFLSSFSYGYDYKQI